MNIVSNNQIPLAADAALIVAQYIQSIDEMCVCLSEAGIGLKEVIRHLQANLSKATPSERGRVLDQFTHVCRAAVRIHLKVEKTALGDQYYVGRLCESQCKFGKNIRKNLEWMRKHVPEYAVLSLDCIGHLSEHLQLKDALSIDLVNLDSGVCESTTKNPPNFEEACEQLPRLERISYLMSCPDFYRCSDWGMPTIQTIEFPGAMIGLFPVNNKFLKFSRLYLHSSVFPDDVAHDFLKLCFENIQELVIEDRTKLELTWIRTIVNAQSVNSKLRFPKLRFCDFSLSNRQQNDWYHQMRSVTIVDALKKVRLPVYPPRLQKPVQNFSIYDPAKPLRMNQLPVVVTEEVEVPDTGLQIDALNTPATARAACPQIQWSFPYPD